MRRAEEDNWELRLARTALDRALLHESIARGIECCICRNQGGGNDLFVLSACVHGDPGGIDSLSADKIGLRVRSALRSDVLGVIFAAGRVPNQDQRGARVALQGHRDLIQTGLGFVVHASRPPSVSLEGNGAQVAGHGLGRSHWNLNRDRSCA